jgi:hypothetical protein
VSGPTPGPWELAPFNGNECDVLDVVSGYEELPGGRVSANWIAECNLQEGPEENLANARLIAAAPDLLQACKMVAGMAVGWEPLTPGDIAEVKAAIAKAEGR